MKFKLKLQLFNQNKKNYNLKTKNFKKNLKNLKVRIAEAFKKYRSTNHSKLVIGNKRNFTSYINTIINSNSITGAISRVAAIVKSYQQTIKCCSNKEDKEAISEKQVAKQRSNQYSHCNQQTLAD